MVGIRVSARSCWGEMTCPQQLRSTSTFAYPPHFWSDLRGHTSALAPGSEASVPLERLFVQGGQVARLPLAQQFRIAQNLALARRGSTVPPYFSIPYRPVP